MSQHSPLINSNIQLTVYAQPIFVRSTLTTRSTALLKGLRQAAAQEYSLPCSNSPSLYPILSQINPVHNLTPTISFTTKRRQNTVCVSGYSVFFSVFIPL